MSSIVGDDGYGRGGGGGGSGGGITTFLLTTVSKNMLKESDYRLNYRSSSESRNEFQIALVL